MTVFRDWPRTLRRASYKGASFFVERDGVETGRRLVVHEFPHRDTPYVEDMGRDAYKMSVTAYVVGNQSDGAALALRRACESKGAGPLSLPLERFVAHCEKFQRDFSKDKLGYIAFSLAFVRDGSAAGPFPVPVLGHLVSLASNAVLAPLRAALLRGFAALGMPSFVSIAAVSLVRSIAAQLQVSALTPGLTASVVPRIALSIANLHDQAPALVAIGAQAARVAPTWFVAQGVVVADAAIVDRVWSIVEAIGDAAPADVAIEIMEGLATFGIDLDGSPAGTASERQLARNAEMLCGLVRIAALAAMSSAVVDIALPDRRSAIAARAKVAEMFAAERERSMATDDHALSVALEDLGGRLVDQISRRIADLAPVLSVASDLSMPSLWWSHRIYGHAARAGDIARRNSVIHPSFMPREIEALAR